MVRTYVESWLDALRFAQVANRSGRLSPGQIQRLLGTSNEINWLIPGIV